MGSAVKSTEMFVFRSDHTGSEAKPPFYPMRIAGKYHDTKLPGHETDHLPAVSAEMKNAWSCTSTPVTHFMALCLTKYRDKQNVAFICYLRSKYPAPVNNGKLSERKNAP
jgi:hypothetical protein